MIRRQLPLPLSPYADAMPAAAFRQRCCHMLPWQIRAYFATVIQRYDVVADIFR